MSPVTFRAEDGIGIIEIDNPPVNALSLAVIEGLKAALAAFAADPALKGLALRAKGRTFVAGGDITMFDSLDFSPAEFNAALLELELSDRPVVAELFGTVLGGGLELAMACHARIAAEGTLLGLPEIKLGIIPGSLGTQRLPRLIGFEAAHEMISTGAPIKAAKGLALGLVDEVVPATELSARARAMIEELSAASLPRASQLEAKGDHASVVEKAKAEAAAKPWLPALAGVAKTIKAAALPFDQGTQVELEEFLKLVRSPTSKALRHVFFAERAATRIPGIGPEVKPRRIETIGVLGVGTMGAGIAMNFALIDMPVTLVESTPEALAKGLERIDTTFAQLVKRGKLTPDQAAAKRALMQGTTQMQALASVDLVIEAVFEDMALKLDVIAKLGAICKSGAIIATNTSTLDVDKIAEASGRPADVVGTHFFSPAHLMRLLEIVQGAKTAPDVMATLPALSKKIGKTPVVSGVCYGFIGNRMAEVYMRENESLQLEGVSPARIDAVAEDPAFIGMAMGPNRMLDMAGVDVGARTVIEWVSSGEGPQRPDYRIVSRTMYERGLHGQKTGKGYYIYEGRTALPNPEQAEMVAELAATHGIARRNDVTDQEIFERLLYSMVNEAALILEEGIALRPGDVDTVWTAGYGFPAWRGGPLFMASQIGLPKVVAAIKAHAERSGKDWHLAPLLEDLAAANLDFESVAKLKA